jgi:hypothetical protein
MVFVTQVVEIVSSGSSRQAAKKCLRRRTAGDSVSTASDRHERIDSVQPRRQIAGTAESRGLWTAKQGRRQSLQLFIDKPGIPLDKNENFRSVLQPSPIRGNVCMEDQGSNGPAWQR